MLYITTGYISSLNNPRYNRHTYEEEVIRNKWALPISGCVIFLSSIKDILLTLWIPRGEIWYNDTATIIPISTMISYIIYKASGTGLVELRLPILILSLIRGPDNIINFILLLDIIDRLYKLNLSRYFTPILWILSRCNIYYYVPFDLYLYVVVKEDICIPFDGGIVM